MRRLALVTIFLVSTQADYNKGVIEMNKLIEKNNNKANDREMSEMFYKDEALYRFITYLEETNVVDNNGNVNLGELHQFFHRMFDELGYELYSLNEARKIYSSSGEPLCRYQDIDFTLSFLGDEVVDFERAKEEILSFSWNNVDYYKKMLTL